MKLFYIYFGPSQHLSNGENLYNYFTTIMADDEKKAKIIAVKHFPNIKLYVTEDYATKSKFGLKSIEIDYLTKNNVTLV